MPCNGRTAAGHVHTLPRRRLEVRLLSQRLTAFFGLCGQGRQKRPGITAGACPERRRRPPRLPGRAALRLWQHAARQGSADAGRRRPVTGPAVTPAGRRRPGGGRAAAGRARARAGGVVIKLDWSDWSDWPKFFYPIRIYPLPSGAVILIFKQAPAMKPANIGRTR